MTDEEYCRLYKDEHCFSWEFISVSIFSKDFVIEMREYLHPKHINNFQQRWNRIHEIVQKFGAEFYFNTFDNYGYEYEGPEY